jgi:hypothetical protein
MMMTLVSEDPTLPSTKTISTTSTFGPLRFLEWQTIYETEHPFVCTLPLQPGVPDSNIVLRTRTNIPIHDVRGRESDFSLDQHGFIFVRDESLKNFDNFASKEDIEKTVLPAMENLLKRVVNDAEGVFCFDWRVSWTICTCRLGKGRQSFSVHKDA